MSIDRRDLTLRDARVEEARVIEALWDATYGDSSRSSAQDIPALLAHGPSARLLVAEVDGVIAGTLIAAFDGWRGNMYRLAVHPEYQRHGIATRLVNQAHDWLRSIGCTRITALVEGDHEWATRFWESMRYEHDIAMRRYHLDIDEPGSATQ
jgi:GNAT superfamily N-acetyltransferase